MALIVVGVALRRPVGRLARQLIRGIIRFDIVGDGVAAAARLTQMREPTRRVVANGFALTGPYEKSDHSFIGGIKEDECPVPTAIDFRQI